MGYLFGDTDLAARRLEILARVFREPTRTFLRDAVSSQLSLDVAVDLGCGPGFSTRLLAETLACRKVLGLDNSRSFIEAARGIATPVASFDLHDVSSLPLPVDGIDLIFGRFLLSHLPQPGELAHLWLGELRPGGLLLLEEPDCVQTGVPAFSTYLGIVASMLRDQASELYLGSFLDGLEVGPKAVRLLSRVRIHAVSDRDAATLFSMNLPNWRDSAFVRAHYAAAEVDSLHRELQAIAQSPGAESNITWRLRQIAFQRTQSW